MYIQSKLTVIPPDTEQVVQFVPKRTVAYVPPVTRVAPPRPVFEHVHRVVHPPPAPVHRVQPAPPVVVKQQVHTDIPAYTGPRRRPQKFIEDPAQAFETPAEKVILTPKRVPAYAPDQDLPEEFNVIVPTVPPPASRLRVAYTPEKLVAPAALRAPPVTRFAPIAIRPVYQPTYAYGPVHHTTSYQPVPYASSRCSRCRGYGKAKSR